MANHHSIDVEIAQSISNGYRVKISVLDLGMYLNGCLLLESDRNTSGWSLLPPTYQVNSKRYHPVEFNKRERLWVEMEHACIEQVQYADHETRRPLANNGKKDVVITDIDDDFNFAKELDKAWDEDGENE